MLPDSTITSFTLSWIPGQQSRDLPLRHLLANFHSLIPIHQGRQLQHHLGIRHAHAVHQL